MAGKLGDARSSQGSLVALLGLDEREDAPGCFRDDPPPARFDTNSLIKLLRDEMPSAPWKSAFFMDHCEQELNAEAAHFFYEVEALKYKSGDVAALNSSADYLLVPDEDRKDPRRYSNKIVEVYVAEGAHEQINISSDMREKTLKLSKEADMHGPAVFEEAQREVLRLMLTDIVPRFVRKLETENMSKDEGRVRLKKAIVLSLLTFVGVGLCLGFFVPRPYFVLFLLPWMYTLHILYSSYNHLCVIAAFAGGRFVGTKFQPIECPIIKGMNWRRAKYNILKIFSGASLLTLLGIVLTFIIEAGLQRGQLY